MTVTFVTELGQLPELEATIVSNIDDLVVAVSTTGTTVNVECANKGLCNRDTGLCECFPACVVYHASASSFLAVAVVFFRRVWVVELCIRFHTGRAGTSAATATERVGRVATVGTSTGVIRFTELKAAEGLLIRNFYFKINTLYMYTKKNGVQPQMACTYNEIKWGDLQFQFASM